VSSHGADLLVIGVDGLDFDLVHELRDRVPTLYKIVSGTQPHASVFPPDSVPSWTTIVTGLAPTEHAQLSNVKYFLEDAQESTVQANLNDFSERCFWERATGDTIAVVNPFLAYPPWAPRGAGAMVSGPPFAEEAPMVADPNGLLTPHRRTAFPDGGLLQDSQNGRAR
jgi:predicted AlkP superfamily phosphohydrolase/phosphomutase